MLSVRQSRNESSMDPLLSLRLTTDNYFQSPIRTTYWKFSSRVMPYRSIRFRNVARVTPKSLAALT
jgi:hypothetical protein